MLISIVRGFQVGHDFDIKGPAYIQLLFASTFD